MPKSIHERLDALERENHELRLELALASPRHVNRPDWVSIDLVLEECPLFSMKGEAYYKAVGNMVRFSGVFSDKHVLYTTPGDTKSMIFSPEGFEKFKILYNAAPILFTLRVPQKNDKNKSRRLYVCKHEMRLYDWRNRFEEEITEEE